MGQNMVNTLQRMGQHGGIYHLRRQLIGSLSQYLQGFSCIQNGGCLGFLKPSTVSPGFNVQWIIVNGFVFSWGSLSNVYVSHKNKSKLKTQFSRKTLTTYTSATLSGICLPLYSTQKSINHWVPGTYSMHSAAISLSSLLGSTPKNMSHLFQKEFLLLKTKRT